MSKDFVVLLYHGVTSGTAGGIENHSKKHVLAADFATQMSRLAEAWQVVPYRDLLDMKRSGEVPPRTVSVTFDDGFENNYTTAFPILERHQIPVTFFLATGFIGTSRVFWVDQVEYLINEWTSPRMKVDSLGASFDLTSEPLRIHAVTEIKARLKRMPGGLIESTLMELEQQFGSRPSYDYPNYRMLTWDMVREMSKSRLCEIGAHTVDHSILSHLDRAGKKQQIETAKISLEAQLDKEIDLFSYPEGQTGHFDDETIDLLKEAGFRSSPTAIFGRNDVSVSDFHVRRNMVEFAAPFDLCLDPPAS